MSVMYGVFQWAGFDLSSAPVCGVKSMLLVLLLFAKQVTFAEAQVAQRRYDYGEVAYRGIYMRCSV